MNLRKIEVLYRDISDRAVKHVWLEGCCPPELYELFLRARLLRNLMKEQEHERERVPAGQPDGGEWMPGGGDKHPGGKILNISKTIEYLRQHLSRNRFGDHNCARNVRNALKKGGIDIAQHPKSAKDYGPYLMEYGFDKVAPTPLPDYQAQMGDIVVIQPIDGNGDGHIAIFDGKVWYSDFRQYSDIWPGQAYRNAKPSYEIFRYPNLAN